MADVVFGQKYDLLGKPNNRYIVDAIAGSNVRTTVLLYLPKLVIGRLDKRLFPASIKARNTLLRFIGKLLYERSQLSAPIRKDIFSILQTAKDANTGKGLQSDEIGAESTTLVIAGKLTMVPVQSQHSAAHGKIESGEQGKIPKKQMRKRREGAK